MKIKILLGLLVICNTFLYSQKCLQVIDPITNEKKSIFEYKKVGVFDIHIKYELINGQIFLSQEFQRDGQLDKIFPAGSTVYLKLESGEILILKSLKDVAPLHGAAIGTILTYYNFTSILSKEDLIKLSNSSVTFIRMPSPTDDNGSVDLEKYYIHKSKKAYKKGAECMLKSQ